MFIYGVGVYKQLFGSRIKVISLYFFIFLECVLSTVDFNHIQFNTTVDFNHIQFNKFIE